MAERGTLQPETAERLGQQILEFVDKAEFGTTQFRAVNDFFDLQSLYSLRELDICRLAGEVENTTKSESDIRVYEMRIALLEHQIEHNKSQLPGYSQTFNRIERDFSDLHTISTLEAEQKFTDFSEMDHYVTQIYETALDGAEEIISMKKDAS